MINELVFIYLTGMKDSAYSHLLHMFHSVSYTVQCSLVLVFTFVCKRLCSFCADLAYIIGGVDHFCTRITSSHIKNFICSLCFLTSHVSTTLSLPPDLVYTWSLMFSVIVLNNNYQILSQNMYIRSACITPLRST